MRALLALLLLANLGFFALAQGWLQPYVGLATQHQREPQRLAAQIDAASVRVVAAPEPTVCVQAGPFAGAQLEAAEAALAPHAAGGWQRLPADGAGEWRLLLGGFADAAALARKQDELHRQGRPTELIGNSELLLGRYADQAAAEAAWQRWQQRGVDAARLQAPAYWLRVERADSALRQRLQDLAAATPGASVSACAARR